MVSQVRWNDMKRFVMSKVISSQDDPLGVVLALSRVLKPTLCFKLVEGTNKNWFAPSFILEAGIFTLSSKS